MLEMTRMPPLPGLVDVTVTANGRTLIDGLTLQLGSQRTVLLGPNGAGKSLTLRLIQGLIEPEQGYIRQGAGRTSLVAQQPVLLRRSVRANLDHALKIHGIAKTARPGRILHLLGLGRLTDLAERPARVLSGGEQQRLSLLRALAAEPAMLLLDEPSAHLDPQSTAHIERVIFAAAVPFLLITHDLGQARRMADRVLFMHHGRLVEDTPADAFFTQPQSAEANAFLNGDLIL
ncbi:MAG: ATP-binding cassette domain-containing protein [Pseudomonadota bacterium]